MELSMLRNSASHYSRVIAGKGDNIPALFLVFLGLSGHWMKHIAEEDEALIDPEGLILHLTQLFY